MFFFCICIREEKKSEDGGLCTPVHILLASHHIHRSDFDTSPFFLITKPFFVGVLCSTVAVIMNTIFVSIKLNLENDYIKFDIILEKEKKNNCIYRGTTY